jgi:hypothetical protein
MINGRMKKLEWWNALGAFRNYLGQPISTIFSKEAQR